MRRKKVSELQNTWGSKADKAEASLEDVEKRPHRKSKPSKVCKVTKGAHVNHKLVPFSSYSRHTLVWHCECGKHLNMVHVCKVCKSHYDKWKEFHAGRIPGSFMSDTCGACLSKEQE